MMREIKLSHKLMLGMGVVIGFFSLLAFIWNVAETRYSYQKELLEKARVITSGLVATRRVIAENQDRINYDSRGHFEFKHLNPAAVGRQVAKYFNQSTGYRLKQTRLKYRNSENAPDPVEKEMLKELAANPKKQELYRNIERDGHRYFYYMKPLYMEEPCLDCHGEPMGARDIAGYPKEGYKLGDFAGAISLVVPADNLQIEFERKLKGNFLLFLAFLGTIGLFSYTVIKNTIEEPLKEIVAMTGEVATGNFKTKVIETNSREIKELSENFHQMAQKLKELYHNLEEKVKERTLELARTNEELARANAFKSEIIAMVSHELKTPLTSILAFGEILLADSSNLLPWQKEYLEDIMESGQELLKQIETLLTMAKIEAGKITVTYSPVNLQQFLEQCFKFYKNKARSRRVSLKIKTNITGILITDEHKLKLILGNIIGNAIKFTPPGGKISVGLRKIFGRLYIYVKDSGPGIAPEDLPNIFNKFWRKDQKVDGTGLGLTLAKDLCELLGYEIKVKSKLGRGSSFYIVIKEGFSDV